MATTKLKLLILALFAALTLRHAHGLGDLASPAALDDDERMDVVESSFQVENKNTTTFDGFVVSVSRGGEPLSNNESLFCRWS